MNRRAGFAWLLWMVLVMAGCRGDGAMVLDLTGNAGFFDRGFPSDLQLTQKGAPDVTRFPNRINATLAAYRDVIHRDIRGYAPTLPIYLKFEGAVSSSHLWLPDDPRAYASKEAPVQLIDLSSGDRLAIKVAYREKGDLYRPKGLLQALPASGFLRENGRYALVVTRRVAPTLGEKAPQNEVLGALLRGEDPRGVNSKISVEMAERALDVYAPLRGRLAADGIDVGQVLGATVWTTGEPSRTLRDLVVRVAEWEAPGPLSGFSVEERDDFYILTSSWMVPGLQKGRFPYVFPTEGGAIHYKDGEPEVQYTRPTPFELIIPKGTMPASGFPLLIYNHGTGGLATQGHKRGRTIQDGTLTEEGSPAVIAAGRNWASCGMGGHMGGDHQGQEPFFDALGKLIPGLSLNIAAYNFMNPQAMRDNFFQMVAERILFRRMVNGLAIDASLCPETEVQRGGAIHFDAQTQVVMGQSLGAMTASAMAVTDPDAYSGVIGTGAGTYGFGLVMHLAKLEGRKPLGYILEPLIFHVGVGDIVHDPFHPVWALANMALSESDISIIARRWAHGDASVPEPHVFMVEGHFDDWVSVEMQMPLLVGMETELAGPDLPNLATKDQYVPTLALAGLGQLDYAAGANRPGGRTSLVVRYPEDGIKSGHHVAFQYERPKHQIGCFLEDIALGRAPWVVEGAELHGSCE